MLNRDRDFVEIEVQLQNRAAVGIHRCGEDAGLTVDQLILIVLGLGLVFAGDAGSRLGLRLAGVRHALVLGVALAVVVLIVEFDFVIHINSFPFGVHGVMLCAVADEMLVRRNLGNRIAAICIFGSIVNDIQICQLSGCTVFLNTTNPSFEFIAGTSRRIRNRRRLVDLDILACCDLSSGIVVIPVDEGQDLLILLNIDRLDLDDIVIFLILVQSSRRYNSLRSFFSDPGICREHIEGIAGEHISIGLKCRAVPFLYFPVAENKILSIVRRGTANSDRFRLVDIETIVSLCNSALTGKVLQFDSFSADKLAAPLGVQVYLADGSGIFGADLRFRIKLAVLADCRLVNDERLKVERVLQGFISVPTYKVEIDALAAYVTDLLTLVDIERLCLRFAGVLNRIRSGIVRMEIHLVFGNAPFRINRDAVSRHGLEVVLLGTSLVSKPTEENISVPLRNVIVRSSLSVRGNIHTVIHQLRLVQLASGPLLGRGAAAINIDTVHISDRFLDSLISDLQLIIATSNSSLITCSIPVPCAVASVGIKYEAGILIS